MSMATSNLTEQVFLIALPNRPQASSEIERATRKITAQTPRHVIIDFSQVEIISSSTISELLIIESHLHELNRKLVLCCLPEKIQALLVSVGLQSLFLVANDSLEAFEMLEAST
jgi:anti-anti-sigma regulatory factor